MRVLDYLMTCFQTEDKTFELSAVLDFLKEPSPPDVTALCTALMYMGWFNEIVANDFKNLGPGGIIALAPLFSVPSPITKAVFVNVGGSTSSPHSHSHSPPLPLSRCPLPSDTNSHVM